jgi:putative PIN family toxin of toxin-antitoxin system
MHIVIDTNVWVSGLLWRGLPGDLLHLAETGQVEVCMAPSMLIELAEVLSHERLQPRLRELGLRIAEIISYVAGLVTILDVPEGDPIVAADPDDDVFVHCAVVAGAACIVFGDRHLVDLREYAGIPILTVRQFFSEVFEQAAGD